MFGFYDYDYHKPVNVEPSTAYIELQYYCAR
jgi:hypothetical protein